MMSEDSCHCIFYQFDGERSAHAIKDFFSGRRYNVQFSLQTLQNANIRHVSNLGVFILLLTPESYDLIKSQKHIDLNAIFPSPEFSVVLIYSVEKTMTDITTLLYSRIRDFSKWKILEYSSMPSLGIQIMELIEQFEEKCRRVSLQQKVQVWPREGIKSHSEVLLIFTEPVDNDSVVSFVQEWDGVNGTAERQNHMTFCFTVGDMKPGENKVEVLVNDTSIGRVELHGMSMESTMAVISNILHNVTNPVEFICQCLHITPSNREGLDSGLEELLSNRNSSISDIFETVYSERSEDFHSNYELPTLLHFCAKYGFTRFCMKLLRLPGHDKAIKMKNKDGLLPYQIAQNEGFDHLASVLHNSDNVPCDSCKLDTQSPTQHQIRPKDSPRNGPRLSPSNAQRPDRLDIGERTSDLRISVNSEISDQSTSPIHTPHRRMTVMTSPEPVTLRNQAFPGKYAYGKLKKNEDGYQTINE